MKKILIILFLGFIGNIYAVSIYDFKVKDIKGNEVNLSSYKGSPVLIVNVASKCGYTYQYEGLEKIYKKYKDRGFKIIGFPANNFGAQEPGSNDEIAKFCKLKFDVSFDMMGKISVKGEDKHILYKYLTENSDKKGEIGWNFEKFLIDKNGKIVDRFESSVEPNSEKILKRIESIL
ncbi:MAG TPA: glutathione peroxidase [Leptospiraceae bacterium]|nr:glutathione peroxidase [Leptospiraceae bacterium]HMW07735.1 glutathione peroxidase [Leptospiraceae bacterium]HMX31995.1 glutathione peroxidase [Leptospiraceae bacterium]HMY33401.1 glutathione peroxidase [Leptospiraceae bacterium]HMZ64791.1 glutathione peroxidase [Leptospiraceae bacterium]